MLTKWVNHLGTGKIWEGHQSSALLTSYQKRLMKVKAQVYRTEANQELPVLEVTTEGGFIMNKDVNELSIYTSTSKDLQCHLSLLSTIFIWLKKRKNQKEGRLKQLTEEIPKRPVSYIWWDFLGQPSIGERTAKAKLRKQFLTLRIVKLKQYQRETHNLYDEDSSSHWGIWD